MSGLVASLLLLWPQDPGPRDLAVLLQREPSLARAAAAAAEHRLQILLAEPFVDASGCVRLRRSAFGSPAQYFYPASAIKVCAAVAALLELNRINEARGASFGLGTALCIAPRFPGDTLQERDPGNQDGGAITVGHEIRKLFLVSDNVAFNRLYELCGHRGLNEALHAAGFASACVQHRLSEVRTPAEQVRTRAVTLVEGDLTLEIPERDSDLDLELAGRTELSVGTAFRQGDRLVDGPMDFARKNGILLADLQDMIVELVRPEIETGKRGFPGLSTAQRAFLLQAMRELPRESKNPVYDPARFPDECVRFLLPGLRKVVPKEHLRVYDKIGRAYGFSVENAYVEDLRTGRGFFLAAVLYTNPDGVLNDDQYAYAEIADPFFAALGEVVAREVFGVREAKQGAAPVVR